MGFISDEDREDLTPSELLPDQTPIPTQVVSSDEYYPYPQTEKQRELQARLLDLGDSLAKSKVCRAAASSRPRPAWRHPTWR